MWYMDPHVDRIMLFVNGVPLYIYLMDIIIATNNHDDYRCF